jgi:putative transposase
MPPQLVATPSLSRWTSTIIAWGGTTTRDLMLLSVERRFSGYRTKEPVEWLSDNGSCYTARETISFAQQLGLVPCFTPVRSPESNGMAEAFVKTSKRDYVYVHDRPDAKPYLHNWIAGSMITTSRTRRRGSK